MAPPPGSGPGEGGEPTLRGRFFTWQTCLSFLFAFGLLALLLTQVLRVDYQSVGHNLRKSQPLWLLLGLLVYYAGFPLRAWRWEIFLRNVGYGRDSGLPSRRRLSEVILVGWFANCILPAKLGDAYRAHLLRKESQVGFMAGLGTILAEHAVDVIALFLIMAAAALMGLGAWDSWVFLPLLMAALALTLGVVAALALMRRFGLPLSRWLPLRLQPYYAEVHRGVLGSLGQIPLLALLSIAIWFTEVGRLFLVIHSLGFSLSFSLVLFAALASALLTAVPFTPGGLGLVEGGVVGILVLAVSQEVALSITLLDRAISYYSIIAVGLLIFLARRAWAGQRRPRPRPVDIEQSSP